MRSFASNWSAGDGGPTGTETGRAMRDAVGHLMFRRRLLAWRHDGEGEVFSYSNRNRVWRRTVVDLVTNTLPLVGVIVGSVGTYLTTAAVQRSQWRRTHGVRWDERRLTAYIQYGDAVKRMHSVAVRICASRGFDYSVEPLEPAEGLAVLASASAERSARWEAVLLLGDRDTVKAARAWHQTVWRLEWYARGMLTDRPKWDEAVQDADAARHVFYVAARKDLGMPAPASSDGLWPPPWLPSTIQSATSGPTMDGSDSSGGLAPDSRSARAE